MQRHLELLGPPLLVLPAAACNDLPHPSPISMSDSGGCFCCQVLGIPYITSLLKADPRIDLTIKFRDKCGNEQQ